MTCCERNLKAYLEDKRLVSQTVEIDDVDYVRSSYRRHRRGELLSFASEVVAEVAAGSGGAACVRQRKLRPDDLPEQVLRSQRGRTRRSFM